MYKQALIVRKDLKMSPGKTAAQCCHASLGAYRRASKAEASRWLLSSEKKVVLLCNDLEQLKDLMKKAKALKLPYYLVQDAGMTELKPGTITCLGVGPGSEVTIDKVTGSLKLL